jgi:diguanylate cyclase (GGDEF)-like protein
VTPLHLDPQTTLVFQFVQAMVNGCLLLLAWLSDRKSTPLAWWSACHLVVPAASVALGASVAFSLPWVFGLGHVLMNLHWSFMLAALRPDDGRRWLIAVLPPLTIAAAVAVSGADKLTIMITVRCVSDVVALAVARELWLGRSNAPLLRWSLIALVIAQALLVTIYGGGEPSPVLILWIMAYGSANALLFIALSKAGVEQALRTAATTDSLTQLANRGAFRAGAQSLLDVARKGQRPVALVMFDLDQFKSINDRFGHPAGDQVLCAFADILRTRFRKGDMLSRLGGEEFAAILADMTADQMTEIVERVRSAFAASHMVIGDAAVKTTVSAGIVLDQQACHELDSLFARADELLYRAKTGGRNRFELEVLPADLGASAAVATGGAVRALTLAPAEA